MIVIQDDFDKSDGQPTTKWPSTPGVWGIGKGKSTALDYDVLWYFPELQEVVGLWWYDKPKKAKWIEHKPIWWYPDE